MIEQSKNPVDVNRTIIQKRPTVGTKPQSLIPIILHSWWIILITTVISLAATVFFISKIVPEYSSTAKIYVEKTGPKIFTESEKGVMTQSKNYLFTQAELLVSTPILADTVKNLNVEQMKTFMQVINPVEYLRSNLLITVGGENEIIYITLKSLYPREAAQIVNAVVDSYKTYHTTSKRGTLAEVLKILRNEKEISNKELMEKLETMMDFKRKNYALAFEGTQGNVIIQRLQRLSEVLTEAQLNTVESKFNYESVKQIVSEPSKLKQFIEAQQARGIYNSIGGEIGRLISRLEQMEYRLADRLRQVNPNTPAVKALEDDIANLRARITDLNDEFTQAQIGLAEQEYLTTKEKEDQIAQYYEDQLKKTLSLNEQLADYTILQSEWEQTKKLCDNIDNRINELNVTEDAGALNITILEDARPAEKPLEPPTAKYIFTALVIGLMFGGGLALIRDWTDKRFRSTEEISSVLGMPILGIVPSMPRRQSVVARGQKVHYEPDSQAAEAYRSIRTAVFFGAPNSQAKTILITSPVALEGKTTLASNLAIAMAQAGKRILLLDADFRNPMQYQIFEINSDDELVSLLSGTTTLEKAIKPTGVEGLEILPCRIQLVNSAEILNSDNFAKLLKLLANQYDYVIIDSPPVVPVTDAQILAAICDITLLTLRAEKTTKKMSKLALEGLSTVGARVLGVVVNDVPKKNHYTYLSEFKNYYGYSQSKKKMNREKKTAEVS